MNSILAGGAPFPAFEDVHLDQTNASALFRGEVKIAKAEL
jgi:hypothetical protein